MRCKELEAVLEQEGLELLPLEARAHLTECPACQDFVSDLSAIAAAASRLPSEVNPPERVWVSLRAQLEAEGIIHEPRSVEGQSEAPWWQGLAAMFRLRVLATVAAGVLVVLGAVYVANRPHTSGMVTPPTQPAVAEIPKATPSQPSAPAPVPVQTAASAPAAIAGPAIRRKPPVHDPDAPLKPAPSESIYAGDTAAVLSQTESSLSGRELAHNAAVDASLRDNLRTLNGFISECEARLKQNPQDQLTRQYLNMAYQQKAELLTAMMDSGRSDQ